MYHNNSRWNWVNQLSETLPGGVGAVVVSAADGGDAAIRDLQRGVVHVGILATAAHLRLGLQTTRHPYYKNMH